MGGSGGVSPKRRSLAEVHRLLQEKAEVGHIEKIQSAPERLRAGAGTGSRAAAAALARRATAQTVEYTFDKSAPIGLTLAKGSNRIKTVEAGSQAEAKGVQTGGELKMINDAVVKPGESGKAMVAAKLEGAGTFMKLTIVYQGKGAVEHVKRVSSKDLCANYGRGGSGDSVTATSAKISIEMPSDPPRIKAIPSAADREERHAASPRPAPASPSMPSVSEINDEPISRLV